MRKVRSETGLTDRKIRHYEAVGLLGEVTRSDGNRRVFDPQQHAQLKEIAEYRALGFSLRQIGALLDPETTAEELSQWAQELEAAAEQSLERAQFFRQAALERRPIAS